MGVIDSLKPILRAIDGVDLSGLWGEAFLHPELYLEILRLLKSQHIGVHTVSNGILITDKLAEQLVLHGLDSLEISVDAAREETFRRIRNGGELQQVINGLKSISFYKEKLRRDKPEVKLLFLGMRDNIEELPEFVLMAHSLNIRKVVLQAMGEYETVTGKSVAMRDKALGRRWLKEARKKADTVGVQIELFPPDQFLNDTKAPESNQEKDSKTTKDCFFPWDRAVITADGDVLPCCSAPKPLGNLKEKLFEEIWCGPAYRQLRLSFLEGDLPPMCSTCTGQGWREIRGGDSVKMLLALERIRLRQQLRHFKILRKIKHALNTVAGS